MIKYLFHFFNINFYFSCYIFKIYSFNKFIKNICTELVEINKFFGKIFQWQMQEEVLDDELAIFLKLFFSNVPYSYNDIDYTILENAICYAKNKNDTLIIENNMKPINSGTVALVFKGKLNGKDIVIKLLRNNIKTEIKNFINIYIILLDIYSFFASLFYINNSIIRTNVKNNLDILMDQCNLINEVQNIELFREKTNKNKNIVIPNVYKEYTEVFNNIIIMDFLYGKSFDDLTRDEIEIYKPIVKTFIYDNYLTYKLIHSDLHIGNVIFVKNNDKYVLGIIDFGLVQKITVKQSNIIFNLFISIINNNKRNVMKSLLLLSSINENIDYYVDKLYDKLKNTTILSDNKLVNFSDINILIKNIKTIEEVNITKDSSELLLSLVSSMNLSTKFDTDSNNFKDIFNLFLKNKKIYCD